MLMRTMAVIVLNFFMSLKNLHYLDDDRHKQLIELSTLHLPNRIFGAVCQAKINKEY
jgi:hypothetical protein